MSFFILFVAVLTLLWRLIYIRIFTAPHLLRRALISARGNAGQTLVDIVLQAVAARLFSHRWG